jgi:Right handed beta helix region
MFVLRIKPIMFSKIEGGIMRRRVVIWGMAAGLIVTLSACSSGPSISIQSLIDNAAIGATVSIPPGVYRENLTISKSITLVGKIDDSVGVEIVGTEDGETAIEVIGDTEATLRNITVKRSLGVGISTDNTAHVALVNIQARDCSSSGLSIRGQSSVVATDCEFTNSARNAITITSDGQLEATNCLLEGSAAAGLAIVTTGDVLLTSCSLRYNGEHAVSAAGSATLTFRDIAISDNGHGQPTDGQAVGLGTGLFHETGSGVWVRDDVSILLDECAISASSGHGIIAFGEASVELVSSDISTNGGGGIHLASNGDHRLYDTLIAGNIGTGVFLAGSSSVEMDGCVITANGSGGVALYSIQCHGDHVLASPWQYSGQFAGTGNTIPGPGETDGNGEFSCCPESRRMPLELPTKETESEESGT